MKTPFLKKTYTRLPDLKLNLQSEEIVSNITGNPNFPATQPMMVPLNQIRGSFNTAIVDAAGGDKSAIGIRNQLRDQLVDYLDRVALSAEYEAQKDRAKLLGTGFDVSSEAPNVAPLGDPQQFKLTDGRNKGELKTSIKGDPQAVSYSHEYTLDAQTDNNTKWVAYTSTSAEHTFTNLPNRTLVHCRVGLIGRKKQIAYSETVSRIVQ